ncbi:MAG: prolyl aminopeptidase [Rhodoferax sp.]|nr:prolyl aminopeptidase [Rhodoferax sp.]
MTAAARSYPPIEPLRSGFLPVDAVHTLYWEESGNPQGMPVVLLHGGPGSGTTPQHRQFFDPAYYRIILFDQRGAGRSMPLGDIRDNTTALLVADMERLRGMLEIDRWLVFGGSWGSTLALAYAQTWPQHCHALVLRGVFLCTPAEIDWFLNGMAWFFPQAHAEFRDALGLAEHDDVLQAYASQLFGDDAARRLHAARAWNRYESRCLHLLPQPQEPQDAEADAHALAVSRLEAHYFLHGGFLEPQQLLRDAGRLHGIPAIIVQGRYDVICPPTSAWRLQQAWPQCRLQIIDDAGHSAFEPGIQSALVDAMDRFRDQGHFDPCGDR